jgi:hypothetical protein
MMLELVDAITFGKGFTVIELVTVFELVQPYALAPTILIAVLVIGLIICDPLLYV